MAEKHDVVEVEKGEGEPSVAAKLAKVESLRGSASFIRNVVKTYGRQLAREQHRKLVKLIQLLECDISAEEFYRRYPLAKIEGVIDKLKANFKALLTNEVIVIADSSDVPSDQKSSTSKPAGESEAKSKSVKASAKTNSHPKSKTLRKANPAPEAESSMDSERRFNPSRPSTPEQTSSSLPPKSVVPAPEPGPESAPETAPEPAPVAAPVPVSVPAIVPPPVAPSTPSPKANFERRPQPANVTVDLTSPIGSRRADFERRTYSPATVSPPVSIVSNPQLLSSPNAVFERRANPPAPTVVEPSYEDKSLEEARKKLAALRGEPPINVSPIGNLNLNTVQLASNSNDPRGRKASYVKNLSNPLINNASTLPTPPGPLKWPQTGPNYTAVNMPNIPTTPPLVRTRAPLNLNTSAAAAALTAATTSPCTNIAPGQMPNSDALHPTLPDYNETRRYNATELRDTRDPRCNKWKTGNSNTLPIPGQQMGSQQLGATMAANQQYPGGACHSLPGYSTGYDGTSPPLNWQAGSNIYNNNNNNNNNNNTKNTNNSNNTNINNNNNNININSINNNNNKHNKKNFSYNNNNVNNWSKNHYINNSNKFVYRGASNRQCFPPPSTQVNNSEPRTYREHREAKAKAAKLQAEKLRRLEAAEKQLEPDTPPATIESERVQLDTSYRSLGGTASNKKIDFKIPKKVNTDKSSETRGETTRREKADRTDKSDGLQEKICDDEENWDEVNPEKGVNASRSDSKKTDKSDKLKKSDKTIQVKITDKPGKSDKSSELVVLTRGEKADRTDKSDGLQEKICDDEENCDEVNPEQEANALRSDSKKPDKTDKFDKLNKSDKTIQVKITDKPEKRDKSSELNDSSDKNDKTDSKDKTDKSKKSEKLDKDKEKSNKSNKEGKKSHKSHHPKRNKSKHRDEKVLRDKDKRTSKNDNTDTDNPQDKEEKEPKVADNTDNLENEPPTQEAHNVEKESPMQEEATDKAVHKSKTQNEAEDEATEVDMESEHEIDDEITIIDVEEQPEDTKPQISQLLQATEDESNKSPPKLPKIKVVLGPNAHTITVIPGCDGDDDTIEMKSEPYIELDPCRIMKRRKSMMPIASKPLVDKSELFTGDSFVYEDVVDHQREQLDDMNQTTNQTKHNQRASKHLATMFEKSSDNCSISTQNIVAGKRRSRINDLTLNETQLSRNVFKMAPGSNPKSKAKPKETKKAKEPTAKEPTTKMASSNKGKNAKSDTSDSIISDTRTTINNSTGKRKRGRPPKQHSELDLENGEVEEEKNREDQQEQEQELPAAKRIRTDQVPPPTRARRKAKRNELEKLNDDIAQMYYAEDVFRATGRRACTSQQKQSLPESSTSNVSSRHSSCSRSNSSFGGPAELAPYIRNVARRGRHFVRHSSGINRASFNAKQQVIGRTMKCKVRLPRCAQLERMQAELSADTPRVIKNTNTAWHAMSAALQTCVVCGKTLRFAQCHYMQYHGEHFGARFPPGELQKLRDGVETKPVYGVQSSCVQYKHKCLFCYKQLQITNNSWVEHYTRHTGEHNYKCSRCNRQTERPTDMARHVLKCGSGAKVIYNKCYSRTQPVKIYVCHLCEFVQLSRRNLEIHWQQQHDLTDQSLAGLGQELVLYETAGVPIHSNKRAAGRKGKQTGNNKQKNKKILKNQKKSMKLKKRQLKLKQKQIEKLTISEKVQLKVEQPTVLCDNVLGMPPPPLLPEDDSLVVINACKLEEEENQQPQAVQQQAEIEEQRPVQLEQQKKQLGDLSFSGIASEVSDNRKESQEEEQEQPAKPLDDWIDVDSSSSASSNAMSKSLFKKFQRFYNKLSPISRSSGRSIRSTTSSCTDGDCADMDSLAKPITVNTPSTPPPPPPLEVDTNKQPTPPTGTAVLSLFSVENVAYRLRAPPIQEPAYYCIREGCKFLFSDEVEGLENHFALEHPQVRWSGYCASCSEQTTQKTQELSIKAELQHLINSHMETPSPKIKPSKLRVRRFTGDLLAVEPETVIPVPQPSVEPQLEPELELDPPLDLILQSESETTDTTDTSSAVLLSLLTDESRLQRVASTTVVNPSTEVVNHPSELGLAINQVFSLAHNSPAQIIGDPPLLNSNFVLTQEPAGELPTQINISLEPLPVSTEQHATGFAMDRFRCMAANCNFCAHTVLRIREHMRFHSYSFGSKDYLQCAYCSHTAKDVSDFVHHGVLVHGLASHTELNETNAMSAPTATTSTSQRIRDLLNKRRNSNCLATTTATAAATTQVTATATATTKSSVGSIATVSLPPTTYYGTHDNSTPINIVLDDLLKPTGYDDSKLYACPYKTCSACLTEGTFVNHLIYHHMTSDHNIGPLTCKFCRQPFERAVILRSHLQQVHARHKYFCSICLETTVDRTMMHEHLLTRHALEYRLISCKPEFLELPTQPDEQQLQQLQMEGVNRVIFKCWVSAVRLPFGKSQMDNFLDKLLDEWLQRRQGRKTIYRSSELHLLSRPMMFKQLLQCAECEFQSLQQEQLHIHLLQHKEEALRVARLSEQPLATAKTVPVTVPAPVARSHIPHPPKWKYVPKAKRFICGVVGCDAHLQSELALRQHLTTMHSYGQTSRCVHCINMDTLNMLSTVEKFLDHLAYHKRFIFQCGACTMFHPKRSYIERHIHDRHASIGVDVVIHRRTDNPRRDEARWLQSSLYLRSNNDAWVCNLCTTILDNQLEMRTHLQEQHGRSQVYSCPFCSVGEKEVAPLINHIRRNHPNQRVQPILNYHHLDTKKRLTLGFYCNNCDNAASSYQRIRKHCNTQHKKGYQYSCPHCEFGDAAERTVAIHMGEEHTNALGLAIQQFERVANDLLDSDYWQIANALNSTDSTVCCSSSDLTKSKPTSSSSTSNNMIDNSSSNNIIGNSSSSNNIIGNSSSSNNIIDNNSRKNNNDYNNSISNEPIVIDEIELLSSDEEISDEQHNYEYACSHCTETSSSVHELRTKHWATKHSDHPFYFSIQPKLRCAICRTFVSNPKALLDIHLPGKHSIRQLVACDVNKPNECAFCPHRYDRFESLVEHTATEAHLSNDLKVLDDMELDRLMKLGTTAGDCPVEYYQCNICRVIMPSNMAMAQHGRVEHSDAPETFSFRLVTEMVIYHCSFCMFASTCQIETMRHMVDHYKRFRQCPFCEATQGEGFEEYLQHCYTFHPDGVKRFREIYPYEKIKKFLMQVLYQFQNGLIISKNSLRRTRYHDDQVMLQVYSDLMPKSQQPSIPRLFVDSDQSVNGNPATSTEQQSPGIIRRRKTMNSDYLAARLSVTANRLQQQPQQQQQQSNDRPSVINWHTSFMANGSGSGSGSGSAMSTPVIQAAQPQPQLQPQPQRQRPSTLQRIAKRRSTFVDIGQLGDNKRHCPTDQIS